MVDQSLSEGFSSSPSEDFSSSSNTLSMSRSSHGPTRNQFTCKLEPSKCLCLETLQSSKFDMLNTRDYKSWFGSDSIMQLAQAGTYHGTDAIREYVEFLDSSSTIFSRKIGLIHNILPIPESISYDDSTHMCTATFVIDACSSLSDRVEGGIGSIDHTGMYKLDYKIEKLPEPMNPTSSSSALIKIKRANVYSPHHYLEHLFTISHTEEVAKEVCNIMKNSCYDTFDANFPSEGTQGSARDESCVEAMMQLKTIDEGGRFDGNSFACRVLHSAMAADNPLHCPHISLLPLEDLNGKIKCQLSQNVSPNDLFSIDDLNALDTIAISEFEYKPTDMMFKYIPGSTCAQRHPTYYRQFDNYPMILSSVICFVVVSFSLWSLFNQCTYFYKKTTKDVITYMKDDSQFEYDEEAVSVSSTLPSLGTSSTSDEDMISYSSDCENNFDEFQDIPIPIVAKEKSAILSWDGITCTYLKRHSKISSRVLSYASGTLAPGDFMAIMGSSGGGKTTLLDIISGRKNLGQVRGELSFMGQKVPACDYRGQEFIRKGSVYIPQEVDFQPNQTPAEELHFVIDVLYGNRESVENQRKLVNSTLTAVGLSTDTWHRPIGGALNGGIVIKGLSGGQRKKLALARALVQNPRVLFIDEISSGLDAESTQIIMQLIRKLCIERKVAVAMIIHQPSQTVFDLFDKLTIVSNGHIAFSGFQSSLLTHYEQVFKKSFPDTTICDLPHQILKDSQDFIQSRNKSEKEVEDKTVLVPTTSLSVEVDSASREECSTTRKVFIVFKRNMMNHYVRNLTNLLARLTIACVLSLILGLGYWQVGSPLQSSTGSSSMIAPFEARNVIGSVFSLFMISYLLPFSMTTAFISDKKFFHADSSLGFYSPWIYCVSLVLLESWVLVIQSLLQAIIVIPMIGFWNPLISKGVCFMTAVSIIIPSNLVGNALVLFSSVCLPSSDLAFLSGAGMVLIWFTFSGGIVNFPSLAPICSWVQWASPVKYSIQAFSTLLFWDTGSYDLYVKLVDHDQPEAIISNIAVLYLMFFIFSILTVFTLSRQCEVH